MSSTNFSYDFIRQIQAFEAAHNVAATSSSRASANDPLNFPYADPSDWSSETSFDTSIPTNPDGSIDVNALLDKLHKMLYYASQGDQMDFNSMLDITAYLMNIAKVMPQLKAQGADGQVEQFLNLPVGSTGQTLIQIIAQDAIPAIIYGTYYKSNGNAAETEQFAKQLISTLQGLSGNTHSLDPILQAAEAIGNPQALSAWMNDPKNQGLSFGDFTFEKALQWETDFSMNSSASPYMDDWRSEEVNSVLSSPDAKKNPFLEYILLMYILMNENGDIQTKIAGRGNLIKVMSNALGKEAAKLNSQWAAGHFTAASAQAFYQELQDLKGLSQDKRFTDSIGAQIGQVFTDMTDPNSQIKVPVPGGTPGQQMTLGQLFQNVQNHTNSWDDMATALNSLAPSTIPSAPGQPVPPTPPGYAAVTNDIGQITTSVTSASSAQGQIVQNLEGLSEQDLAFITATANEVINVNKVIVQNLGSAGN